MKPSPNSLFVALAVCHIPCLLAQSDPSNSFQRHSQTDPSDLHPQAIANTSKKAEANAILAEEKIITNQAYCDFLNEVASQQDSHQLYDHQMDINCEEHNNFLFYTPKNGKENDPITYVSWIDLAYYCNWQENRIGNGNVYFINNTQIAAINTQSTYYLSLTTSLINSTELPTPEEANIKFSENRFHFFVRNIAPTSMMDPEDALELDELLNSSKNIKSTTSLNSNLLAIKKTTPTTTTISTLSSPEKSTPLIAPTQQKISKSFFSSYISDNIAVANAHYETVNQKWAEAENTLLAKQHAHRTTEESEAVLNNARQSLAEKKAARALQNPKETRLGQFAEGLKKAAGLFEWIHTPLISVPGVLKSIANGCDLVNESYLDAPVNNASKKETKANTQNQKDQKTLEELLTKEQQERNVAQQKEKETQQAARETILNAAKNLTPPTSENIQDWQDWANKVVSSKKPTNEQEHSRLVKQVADYGKQNIIWALEATSSAWTKHLEASRQSVTQQQRTIFSNLEHLEQEFLGADDRARMARNEAIKSLDQANKYKKKLASTNNAKTYDYNTKVITTSKNSFSKTNINNAEYLRLQNLATENQNIAKIAETNALSKLETFINYQKLHLRSFKQNLINFYAIKKAYQDVWIPLLTQLEKESSSNIKPPLISDELAEKRGAILLGQQPISPLATGDTNLIEERFLPIINASEVDQKRWNIREALDELTYKEDRTWEALLKYEQEKSGSLESRQIIEADSHSQNDDNERLTITSINSQQATYNYHVGKTPIRRDLSSKEAELENEWIASVYQIAHNIDQKILEDGKERDQLAIATRKEYRKIEEEKANLLKAREYYNTHVEQWNLLNQKYRTSNLIQTAKETLTPSMQTIELLKKEAQELDRRWKRLAMEEVDYFLQLGYDHEKAYDQVEQIDHYINAIRSEISAQYSDKEVIQQAETTIDSKINNYYIIKKSHDEMIEFLKKDDVEKYKQDIIRDAIRTARHSIPGIENLWNEKYYTASMELACLEKKPELIKNEESRAKIIAIDQANIEAAKVFRNEVNKFDYIKQIAIEKEEEKIKAEQLEIESTAINYLDGNLIPWQSLPLEKRYIYNKNILTANTQKANIIKKQIDTIINQANETETNKLIDQETKHQETMRWGRFTPTELNKALKGQVASIFTTAKQSETKTLTYKTAAENSFNITDWDLAIKEAEATKVIWKEVITTYETKAQLAPKQFKKDWNNEIDTLKNEEKKWNNNINLWKTLKETIIKENQTNDNELKTANELFLQAQQVENSAFETDKIAHNAPYGRDTTLWNQAIAEANNTKSYYKNVLSFCHTTLGKIAPRFKPLWNRKLTEAENDERLWTAIPSLYETNKLVSLAYLARNKFLLSTNQNASLYIQSIREAIIAKVVLNQATNLFNMGYKLALKDKKQEWQSYLEKIKNRQEELNILSQHRVYKIGSKNIISNILEEASELPKALKIPKKTYLSSEEFKANKTTSWAQSAFSWKNRITEFKK